MTGGAPERADRPPIWETLGAEIVEAGEGRAAVRFRARPEWLLPSGRLQGGFLASMIDAAMAAAIVSSIGPDRWHTTVELRVSYFRPAALGTFRAEAEVLWEGRTIVHTEATLFNEGGEMVAKGSSTCVVLNVER